MNQEKQNSGAHTPEGFKDTPIGKLPADWGIARLDEIAIPLTETAGQKRYETVSISAGIGFVNQAEKFGKELSGKQYEKYIVLHRGDFSYNKGNSNRYPQGCIYRLNDREVAAVPNVFESFRIVKGYPEYYEQLFISGFLNHQLYKKINHGVRDDGLLNLISKDFYSSLVPIPPNYQQKEIVNVLSTCDKLIRQYQEKTHYYEDLKKYCLIKMFPQNGCLIPDVRFPGFLDTWKQLKFRDIADIKTGPFGSTLHADDYVDDGTPIITTEHFKSGALPHTKENLPQVSDEDYERLSSYILNEGDIVFSRVGSVDINAITTRFQKGWLFSGRVLRVRPNNTMDGVFIHTLLDTDTVKKNIRDRAVGQTMPSINTEILGETPLLLPKDLEEQIRIGEVFSNLDNLIAFHQRVVSELQQQKKALLRLVLTGHTLV